ncbi:hypothetical protein, partial [Meiothermus hypogaeus]|uniref:hypothetical protein n=1 Tax=Meiothermus hypogaeus TaxID=884155 RepID=UPI00197E14CE
MAFWGIFHPYLPFARSTAQAFESGFFYAIQGSKLPLAIAATFDFHTSAVLASYTIFGLLWVIHKSSLEAPSFAQPNFLYD